MIQVENLVKTFDGFRALDGADFHVKKGAIYGLVGPNGAGKSTLIRHLTGIYKQDEGSVLIDGEPVFENPAAKEKIAYIPDELFYFAQADTMEMKKFYEGIYPNFDAGLFEKIREAFPSIDTKQTIRRLSKGKCDPESGVIFLDIISNLERISDHAVNVADYVKAEAEAGIPAIRI